MRIMRREEQIVVGVGSNTRHMKAGREEPDRESRGAGEGSG